MKAALQAINDYLLSAGRSLSRTATQSVLFLWYSLFLMSSLSFKDGGAVCMNKGWPVLNTGTVRGGGSSQFNMLNTRKVNWDIKAGMSICSPPSFWQCHRHAQWVHTERAACFLQNGVVECRRIFCPPANCSEDSLPVHVDGTCCKKCRRKYPLQRIFTTQLAKDMKNANAAQKGCNEVYCHSCSFVPQWMRIIYVWHIFILYSL